MRKTASMLAATLGLCALSGCESIPSYQQDELSRPSMMFDDSLVENAQGALVSQVESGSDVSGGAQASGCSACR